jgi:hypothetical protein
MTTLIINYQKLSDLRKYVESHIIKYDEALKIMSGSAKPAGNRPEHTVYFDFGYKFVYSIEETPSTDFKKIYTLRKLSGSVNKKDRYPNDIALKDICNKLGFGEYEKCMIQVNENDIVPHIQVIEVIGVRNIN